MAVNSSMPKKILVVHGVQAGDDDDQHQDKDIKKLIEGRLNGTPLSFNTEMYRYEDMNDQDAALKLLRIVLPLFVNNLIAQKAVDLTLDVVGDVVIALRNGSTAQKIRQGLVDRIVNIHDEGYPLYILAHSLGTIYAFDAINQLIGTDGYFNRDNRKTWPVLGLVTLGSPLGLRMFERNQVKPLGQGGEGKKFLRWVNYWDRTDPVVSGSFYGKPEEGYDIVERFSTRDDACGWLIHDRSLDTGKQWLMAHTAYWSHPPLGDDLVSLLA